MSTRPDAWEPGRFSPRVFALLVGGRHGADLRRLVHALVDLRGHALAVAQRLGRQSVGQASRGRGTRRAMRPGGDIRLAAIEAVGCAAHATLERGSVWRHTVVEAGLLCEDQ